MTSEPGGVGTEAGRALLDGQWIDNDYARSILAIEAEATRAERERIVTAVRAIPSQAMDTLVPNTGPDVVTRSAVYDAIESRP